MLCSRILKQASEFIYLDYNASAPIHPHVFDALTEALKLTGNPSSLHHMGQALKSVIRQSREEIQSFMEADQAHLIFTGGATESNFLMLHSNQWDKIITTPLEHPSVTRNAPCIVCPMDKEQWSLNLSALEQLLQESSHQKTLISVQMANSESGLLFNLEEIINMAHAYGAKVHTDATQAWGRIPIHFDTLNVDYMTLAPHKVGGPKGIGALAFKKSSPIEPLIQGGSQELGLRAGTENIPGIIGFAETCKAISWEHMHQLSLWHKALEQELVALCPQATLLPSTTPRLPNTSLLYMPSMNSMKQTMHFDLHKISVGSGSACSSGTQKGMLFLNAMGYPQPLASSCVRVSSGWSTEQKHFEAFFQSWKKLFEQSMHQS